MKRLCGSSVHPFMLLTFLLLYFSWKSSEERLSDFSGLIGECKLIMIWFLILASAHILTGWVGLTSKRVRSDLASSGKLRASMAWMPNCYWADVISVLIIFVLAIIKLNQFNIRLILKQLHNFGALFLESLLFRNSSKGLAGVIIQI